MSVLRDLAIDLINVTKSVKDAKYKLFQLEQLREILLHRDTKLLSEFVGDCFSFMTDKSLNIRKFLVKFAKESFDADPNSSIPHILNLYAFILAECNDAMLISIARELTRSYGKMITIIAQMGVGPNANIQESKQMWQTFRSLITKLNEYVSSSRSETVKIHCLRLMEEEIIFGFPMTTAVADPRLARKVQDPRLARATQKDTAAAAAPGIGGAGGAGGSGNTSNSPTIEDIPLHHSFISRNELQREAEELFAKFLFWATKGGPQGYPFSGTLMASLGQNMASVGTVRPNHCANAANAITLLIQGKGGVNSTGNAIVTMMTKMERDNLARATHRLLRATGVYVSDPEGQLTKLRAAVNYLESVTTTEAENDQELSKKRNLQSLLEDESRQLENSQLVSEGMQSEEIVNAIANAEQQKLRQLQSLEAMGGGSTGMGSGNGRAGSSGSGIGGPGDTQRSSDTNKFIHTVALGSQTELCHDIISLENLTLLQNMKLVEEKQLTIKLLPKDTMMNSTGNAMQILCHPMVPTENHYKEYGDLAIRTLLILLDNFFILLQQQGNKGKTTKSLNELTLRTLLMLILSSMDSDKPKYFIPIVLTWSTDLMGNIKQDIPTSVSLPREVWVFVSYALQISFSQATIPEGINTPPVELHVLLQQRLDLLSSFINKMYYHALKVQHTMHHPTPTNGEDTKTSSSTNPAMQLYDSMVIATISRLVQTPFLRQYLTILVMNLPKIPLSLLSLFKAIVLTGGNSAAATNHSLSRGGGGGNTDFANGKLIDIRKETLTLFGKLLFHPDETIHETVLSFLLWNCLSDDFEIRSKFIQLIVNDVMHKEERYDQWIFTFAIQAMISSLGISIVTPWIQATQPLYDQVMMSGDNEEEHAMDIDTSPSSSSSAPAIPPTELITWSLQTAMQEYQDGIYLGDSFAEHFTSTSQSTTISDKNEIEVVEEGDTGIKKEVKQTIYASDCIKAMHLLSQLCVVEYHYLLIYVELYLAYHYYLSSNTVPPHIVSQSSTAVTTTDNTNAPSNTTTAPTWSFLDHIFHELKGILPAISHSHSHVKIFTLLSSHPFETLSFPSQQPDFDNDHVDMTTALATFQQKTIPSFLTFLTSVVQLLYADYSQLVKSEMIQAVLSFIQFNHSQWRPASSLFQLTQIQSQSQIQAPTEVQTEHTTEKVTLDTIHRISDEAYFKLFLPIMNACTPLQIEHCLPRIMKLYENELEQMKLWIHRMTKPRIPPISKSMLLVLFHRLNFEAYDIKAKFVLDTIAICLNNKHEYTFDVLKDALTTLLQDPIPPYAVMRTAILTAQTFGEMKKFIFTDMIPSLISKSVWSIAPKVWEGVIYAMKNFTNINITKHLEPTVVAICKSVPGKELRSVLKVAPVIKPILAKYVQSLPPSERESLCLQPAAASAATAATSTTSGESTAMEVSSTIEVVMEKDTEKEKAMKELLAVNLTTPAPPPTSST